MLHRYLMGEKIYPISTNALRKKNYLVGENIEKIYKKKKQNEALTS